jgi:hypothetical protein
MAGGVFAGAAFAEVGDSGLPFWAMQVGSNWGYNYSGPSGSGSVTHTITERGSGLFSETVFQMTRFSGADPVDRRWFSVSLQSLKLWRASSWDDVDSTWLTYTFDAGLVWARIPLLVGDTWVTNGTGTFTNNTGSAPFSMTVNSSVLAQEAVSVSPGNYTAYKIQHIVAIAGGETFTEIYWWVPYLGIVKSETTDLDGTVTSNLSWIRTKKWLIDFDNGGVTDVSAYHLPSNQFFRYPLGNMGQYGWGQEASMPLAWDYDGDGITEVSFYHIPSNQWFVRGLADENLGQFGWNGDECVPVPGDYNGDGVMERAFYHSPSNRWFIEGMGSYEFGWGGADCIPLPGDYDGDGRIDMVIYHMPSNQWFMYGVGNLGQFGWGGADCIPVPGDYNGDGIMDIAVYHVPDNEWIWRDANGDPNFMGQYGWGALDSFPVPGDYAGTGRFDRAFYRVPENRWFIEGYGPFDFGWGGGDFMPITGQTAVYNWFRFRLGIFQ